MILPATDHSPPKDLFIIAIAGCVNKKKGTFVFKTVHFLTSIIAMNLGPYEA